MPFRIAFHASPADPQSPDWPSSPSIKDYRGTRGARNAGRRVASPPLLPADPVSSGVVSRVGRPFMVCYDTQRYATLRCDTIRYATIRHDTIRYDTIRFVFIRIFGRIVPYSIMYFLVLKGSCGVCVCRPYCVAYSWSYRIALRCVSYRFIPSHAI